MDRNSIVLASFRACITVALRKESVDRNHTVQIIVVVMHVALRKESVDRNEWIKAQYPGCRVALRKESVDRNRFSWLDVEY